MNKKVKMRPFVGLKLLTEFFLALSAVGSNGQGFNCVNLGTRESGSWSLDPAPGRETKWHGKRLCQTGQERKKKKKKILFYVSQTYARTFFSLLHQSSEPATFLLCDFLRLAKSSQKQRIDRLINCMRYIHPTSGQMPLTY